jgi:hypothetical protein
LSDRENLTARLRNPLMTYLSVSDRENLTARLRNPLMTYLSVNGENVAIIQEAQARLDMSEAAEEIERLRGLAGAVTPGLTVSELYHGLRRSSIDPSPALPYPLVIPTAAE